MDGIIGMPEWFEQMWAEVSNADLTLTKEKMRSDLKALSTLDKGVELIRVIINSYGGDVNHALSMHDLLVQHPAKVETIVGGMSASAATLIAQAASPGMRKISENAFYLAHRARGCASGTVTVIQAYASMLGKIDERIAAIYARHSGRSAQDHLTEMSLGNEEGEWLTAEETKDKGYADQVIEMVGLPASAMARYGEELLRQSGIYKLPQGYLPAEPANSRLEGMFSKIISMLTPTALPEPKQATMLTKSTHPALLNALGFETLIVDEQEGAHLQAFALTAIEARLAALPVELAPALNLAVLLEASQLLPGATQEATIQAVADEITRLRQLPGAVIPRTQHEEDPLTPEPVAPWEDPNRSYNQAIKGLRPVQRRHPKPA